MEELRKEATERPSNLHLTQTPYGKHNPSARTAQEATKHPHPPKGHIHWGKDKMLQENERATRRDRAARSGTQRHLFTDARLAHGESSDEQLAGSQETNLAKKTNSGVTKTREFTALGVEVKRSSLSTSRKKRARAGHKQIITEAGDGLFATRRFKPREWILDYRYVGGIPKEGDEVEWLKEETFKNRYPHGNATHVLSLKNMNKEDRLEWPALDFSLYYDTARSGGVGGKANTSPGAQTAMWDGPSIIATSRGLKKGDEILVPYGTSFRIHTETPDATRDDGWYYYSGRCGGRNRPPTPQWGGWGGTQPRRYSVFQHRLGVSAPT